MSNAKNKKKQQLGMDPGTAAHRLRKMLLFEMAKRLGEGICYHCELPIKDIHNFSIEHKIPWLDSTFPRELFFDLDNITFSHLSCNIAASRQPLKGIRKHPSQQSYRLGCRCDECKNVNKLMRRAIRAKKKK